MSDTEKLASINDDALDEPTIAPRTAHPSAAESSVASLPSPGAMVDEYEILREIARGGMGVVFQARHEQLNRLVALKMVLETEAEDDDAKQRFANEARAAAAIEHPGIVPVYDVGRWHEHPYFTMAYVEGESLHTLLRDGPLPPQRAAEIARDVAVAISHAHQQKIIHRDLKPANIMIDQSGATHVTDFGVSKFLEGGSELTSCGDLVGTPHYMPPEQAGGKTEAAGPQSDVYSIGAVLYASLTGRPPFQAATPIDVVSQVIVQDPVPPSALTGSLPVELDVIVLKCLQKSARDRYETARDLADDLTRYLSGEPITARPPGLIQRGKLLVRRHVMLASVSGTVALVLLALCTVVSVLYISARSEIEQLTNELDSTKQLASIDRAVTKRFIQSKDAADSQDNRYKIFEVARLAEIAVGLEKTNPDVALQLAIASIELANDYNIKPHTDSVGYLNRRINELKQDDNENPTLPTTGELLKAAKSQVLRPLTPRQRSLFGLKNEEQAYTSEKTTRPKAADPAQTDSASEHHDE